MATELTERTDMGVGYVLLFGLVVLGGAAAMLVAPGDSLGAAGFALAVTFACLAVVAAHVYP